MRRLTAFILLLSCVASLRAQAPYISEIKIQRNERWWGLFVGEGPGQPFTQEMEVTTGGCGPGFFTVSMMVSNNGRYLWSAYPMEVSFDGKSFKITSEHENIEVKRGGNTLREAYLVCYHNNIKAGGNRLPEELFTHPVYDISMEEACAPDGETLIRYADDILAAGFPAGTFLIPRGWESRTRPGDFNFDLYPDPAGTISELHGKGFKVMLTVTPYVSAAGRNYTDALQEGKLLTDSDGNPLFFLDRSGYSAFLDFTSSELADEFEANVAGLQEKYGIDGVMLDCRAVFAMLPEEGSLHSFIGNWNKIGHSFGMRISSSAFQLPAAASLNNVGNNGKLSWESLGGIVISAVSSGLTGYVYPYCSPGYIGNDTSEELLLRALQVSLMMPVAVLPPSAWKRMSPDNYGKLKSAVEFRSSISTYMADLFHGSENTAEPMVRHMAYQFVHQGFGNCTDQFALGSKYMVAPVLDGSGKRTVRLPRGAWLTPDGVKVRGPRVITTDVSDGRALVYELH